MSNHIEPIEGASFEEPMFSLSPINFFQIECNCHRIITKFPSLDEDSRDYQLPNFESLCAEEQFAEVFLGWSYEGIELFIKADVAYQKVNYPNIENGDSVELFIDTRDVKTAGFSTRFCHHFFFLPEAVDGVQSGEMTRFRTEDAHELCNASDLVVKSKVFSDGYLMHIFIPASCLHGFDPDECNHIGFTYRINRAHGSSQHFSVTSEEFPIEQQPSLWSSLQLIS